MVQKISISLIWVLLFSFLVLGQNDATANINLDVMIRNRHWDGTIATAHNGGILYGPQDTMLVFAKSCEAGADIIEVDVRVTADGYLIAFHDEDFNFINSTGTGLVKERTLAYIRTIRAHSLVPGIPDQPIPTFREVLIFLRGKNVCLNVEPKDNVIDKIIAVVKEEKMVNNVMVQAKSPDKAKWIRELSDDIGMIARYHEEADIELYAPYRPDVMEVNPDIEDALISRIKKLGIRVQMKMGYLKDMDFDEKSWRKRMERGVNVALTDFIPEMVGFLRRNAYNMGNEAKIRSGSQQMEGYTYININPEKSCPKDGKIRYLRIFMHTAGIGKAKIFRQVNDNYLLVSETPLQKLCKGLNIIGIQSEVGKDDLLGIYLQKGEVEADRSAKAHHALWRRGDSGSKNKGEWISDNCIFSVDAIVK